LTQRFEVHYAAHIALVIHGQLCLPPESDFPLLKAGLTVNLVQDTPNLGAPTIGNPTLRRGWGTR
jgi:hypothetical protein